MRRVSPSYYFEGTSHLFCEVIVLSGRSIMEEVMSSPVSKVSYNVLNYVKQSNITY